MEKIWSAKYPLDYFSWAVVYSEPSRSMSSGCVPLLEGKDIHRQRVPPGT